MTEKYITHRCDGSIANHVSIRKQIDGHDYDRHDFGKWLIGKCELDSEWGTNYLHRIHAPIIYCPFCGKELEQ